MAVLHNNAGSATHAEPHHHAEDEKMKARPSLHFILLALSIILCVWFGTNNYKLSSLLQATEESAEQQALNARNHILQLDYLVAQLHSNAETVKNEYTSISPQINELLKLHQQEYNHISTKLKDTEKQLSAAEERSSEIEKQLRDLVSSMNVGHKEQLNNIGKRFKDSNVALSVIVAYDWEESTKNVRTLSLLSHLVNSRLKSI